MSFTAIDLFLYAFSASVGACIGYYLIGLSVNIGISKYNERVARRARVKQARQEEESRKDVIRFCVKCKTNMRSPGKMYCSKCQFAGMH